MGTTKKDAVARQDGVDRRGFLRTIGSGSALAATAVAAPFVVATEAEAYNPGSQEMRARYRESDHVKASTVPMATRR
jgi:hypothetical protein